MILTIAKILRYGAFFIATGVEGVLPQIISDRAALFQWSNGEDGFPPHFDLLPSGGTIPKGYDARRTQIFSSCGLINAAGMLVKIVPDTFLGRVSLSIWSKAEDFFNGRGYEGVSIADLEMHNKNWRKTAVDVMKGQNLGDLSDWFSDARFAQQSFTGTNPNTIRVASDEWISRFEQAAGLQKQSVVVDFIQKAEPGSLFVQDCSYFRKAIKVDATADLNAENRYSTAAVTLFHLPPGGRLHPVAIVIDWRGSVADSVVIFNRKLTPLDPQAPGYESHLKEQKSDWPWRYAKTCAQVSDWIRHELTVHLVNTHLVEEVIIVAANRVFDVDHDVFKLLEPHWYRTLPLNAAARDTLVPKIIFDLIGLSGSQSKEFIKHSFAHFDFIANYVPQDLASRGFPESELSSARLKNYPYAQNILSMWYTIRKFVRSMITLKQFPDDAAVAKDAQIRSWCQQVQNEGQIPTFPTIRTIDELVDAVTMCIHIASPQHTAINYLQNFYMGFVPAKPPCLYTPPPKTREELGRVTEADLLRALPVGHQREWLLATQVPWLLSFKTADEANLITYSESLYNLVRKKSGSTNAQVKEIAKVFRNDLVRLIEQFKKNSDDMTKDTLPYVVMNPASTAVSILI